MLRVYPYTSFSSQKVKCPYCDAVSFSIIEYKTSVLGYLVAVLFILVIGMISIVLMPFLVQLTKQSVHRCAKCLNEVKTTGFFGFNSMEDKVSYSFKSNLVKIISFQIGKFGVLLTRRYLLYIVMTITVGLVLYLFLLQESARPEAASTFP